MRACTVGSPNVPQLATDFAWWRSMLPANDAAAGLVLAEGDDKSNLESTQRIWAENP